MVWLVSMDLMPYYKLKLKVANSNHKLNYMRREPRIRSKNQLLRISILVLVVPKLFISLLLISPTPGTQ
jgi:hypothetical protein